MEKEFFKLRDRYARNLRSKNKSGTSEKALRTAKLKMEEFKYHQWLEEFLEARPSKSNVTWSANDVDEGDEDPGESFGPHEEEIRRGILDVIGEEEDEGRKR